MKKLQKGFTLIELMIVVAIIAILAAIALPAYHDYTVRAKMSEVILAAGGLKNSVSEKVQNDGSLASSGVGLSVAATGKVSGGTVVSAGTITAISSATLVGTLITVVLSPSLATDGKVIWSCGTEDANLYKFVPAECRTAP